MIKIAFFIFLVGIIAIIRIWYLFMNEKTTIRNAIFWTFLWIIVGIGIVVPNSINWVSYKIFRMTNELFFIPIFGLLILLILIYNISISQKRNERRVTKLIQEIAMLNFKFEKENNLKEQNEEKHNFHSDD